MDSEDDLPALEPVHNDDHLPLLVNVTEGHLPQQLDYAPARSGLEEPDRRRSRRGHTSDSDYDDYMPSLMSVSDSSDEQEHYGSEDDDGSEWEDEDDAAIEHDYLSSPEDEDLPHLEPIPGANAPTTAEESLENVPPMTPLSPPEPRPPRQIDPSWHPPRPSPALDPTTFFRVSNIARMRTMLDVLHLGPHPADDITSGHIQREIMENIMMHGVIGQEELRPLEPDPERAKVLVHGLDTVPEGLLTRMARVGGAPGGHEDQSGDEESELPGCAVCWAPLLDDEQDEDGPDDGRPIPFSAKVGDKFEIVSLPCAHVFHAACLLPWFSRPGTTTCPTCRFDIDPDALTWKPPQSSRARSSGNGRTNSTGNRTPIDDWEDQTDVDDEDTDDDEDELLEGGLDDLIVNSIFGGMGLRPGRHGRRAPRGTWTLPEAPGKTLRERIVEKEREMGLRCVDVTCVLAPTDEEPCPRGTDMRQISIQIAISSKCKHTIHPACLVMSARVSGCSPSAAEGEEISEIEVSCPSCRTVGIVSKKDWDEGIEALALVDC